MEGKKDEDEDIENRLPVKTQRPVGFLVFRVQKKGGKNLDAEEDDERDAADPVSKPDEHQSVGIIPPCFLSSDFFCPHLWSCDSFAVGVDVL